MIKIVTCVLALIFTMKAQAKCHHKQYLDEKLLKDKPYKVL